MKRRAGFLKFVAFQKILTHGNGEIAGIADKKDGHHGEKTGEESDGKRGADDPAPKIEEPRAGEKNIQGSRHPEILSSGKWRRLNSHAGSGIYFAIGQLA